MAGTYININPSLGGDSGPSSLALDDLTDVNAAAPADNEVLTFDSGTSEWVNAPVPGDDLGDHIATQNLDMANFDIDNADNLDVVNVNLVGALNLSRTATAVSVQTSGEAIYGVTDTSAARTVTLATADVVVGRTIIVKDESGAAGTNNITIDTQGAELIDGAASVLISVNYGVVRVYSDGVNWFSI